MSRQKLYTSSAASTPLDGSNHSLLNGDDNVQHSRTTSDASCQTYVENDTQSTLSDFTNISQKFDEDIVRRKSLSRWDDCLSKTLEAQSLKSESHQQTIIRPSMDKVIVQEYLSRTVRDPVLPILRELFVRSLVEFYQEIEDQLKLKMNKTLAEWLQETFDQMQDEMLTKKCRCFMLCSTDVAKNDNTQGIIGFLTLKEEEKGSIYIAQCAIGAGSKRHGYGGRLLQHLRTVYPPGTFYWGLCRRANTPAVKFYLKQGATFISNKEVAIRYGYDPDLYAGFQFADSTGNFQPSEPNASVLPPAISTVTSSPERLQDERSHITHKNNSTMTDDPLLDNEKVKKNKNKKHQCCVIS